MFDVASLFAFRCVLSFIGVYYITSDRKTDESEEQLLLTNADLFPGEFSVEGQMLFYRPM